MTTRRREQPPLGRRLVQLRERRRFSQTDLARQSGLSAGIIQSIEQGRRQDPHLSTLVRLCRALNVNLPDLVGDNPSFVIPSSSASAFMGDTMFDRMPAS